MFDFFKKDIKTVVTEDDAIKEAIKIVSENKEMIPLKDFSEGNLRKLYLNYCNNYPDFVKVNRRQAGGTSFSFSFLEIGFCAVAMAALLKKLDFKKDGFAVDIGGPTILFSEALSLAGFSGKYVTINIDKGAFDVLETFRERYKTFGIEPILANALSLPTTKFDILLYNHVIDDIFESTFYNRYHGKITCASKGDALLAAWVEAKTFNDKGSIADIFGQPEFKNVDFWEYIAEELKRKPHIKELVAQTLEDVKRTTIESCKSLKHKGLCLIIHYPSILEEQKIVLWGDKVLPELVAQLKKSGEFKLEAKSSEKTFLHPWFLLRKK